MIALTDILIKNKILYLQRHKYIFRKVCADFEGKLKRRRFKFYTFIKFKSFAARTFRTTQYIYFCKHKFDDLII